jgi:uncharacterized phage protein (TIGR01671 family)
MREIKFRGKTEKWEWVYGGLAIHSEDYCIVQPDWYSCNGEALEFNCIDVIPATVGQYIWLKDKNGVEIYEGDVVEYEKADGKKYKGKILYNEDWFDIFHKSVSDCSLRGIGSNNMEVIGNIYNNPELLE